MGTWAHVLQPPINNISQPSALTVYTTWIIFIQQVILVMIQKIPRVLTSRTEISLPSKISEMGYSFRGPTRSAFT